MYRAKLPTFENCELSQRNDVLFAAMVDYHDRKKTAKKFGYKNAEEFVKVYEIGHSSRAIDSQAASNALADKPSRW